MEKKEKKKDRDFSPKHFALLFFALLIVLMTFIGIMAWRGYVMIDMGTEYLLFGVLIVGAMVFGLAMLVKRMLHRASRLIAGVLGGLVVLVVAVTMLALFSYMTNYVNPAQYTTLTSPEGKKVVVMREWDFDAERINARMEARCALDPEAEAGVATNADAGYSYFAAPKVLGMFYDADAKSEGCVNIGVVSKAQLMYKWEGETLQMYIDQPETGDAGELTLDME